MGMQDRDYWGEWHKQRDAKTTRKTKARRVPVDLLDHANPPKLWGADWHWSLKLLVWLCIAAVLGIIWRVVLKA